MNRFLNHKIIPLILLTGVVLLASCSDSNKQKSPAPDKTTASKKKAGKTPSLVKAPDFTLKKMNGGTFKLSNHKGQVVVVNVWATWCPPCRKEIPDFIKIQKELHDNGVQFLGVSLDREGWQAVRPFAKKYGINYPLALINTSFAREYGPFHKIPVTFIVDKKGNIAYGGVGRINTKSLKKVLKKMAAK